MLWAFLLVSAAIVITLPTKMAIQALGTSFILRMIVSLGPEFTLTVLALALVSIYLFFPNLLEFGFKKSSRVLEASVFKAM